MKAIQNGLVIPCGMEEAAGARAKRGEEEGKPEKKAMRCLSEQRRYPRRSDLVAEEAWNYAVVNPSQVAKVAGMPKSLIVT